MNVFRFYTPYLNNGKTRFSKLQGKTGVYIIAENERIVYVGYSFRNLYKTMYRHFEEWNHKSQEVISYKSRMAKKHYTVRVVVCTKAEAIKLERALIIKYQPRDNAVKYANYSLLKSDKAVISNYDNEFAITLDEAPF